MVAALLFLGLTALVRAEDVPGAAPSALNAPVLQVMVWQHMGVVGQGLPLTGLSVSADNAQLWLVGDGSGGVYRSGDRGTTWGEVLAPLTEGAPTPEDPDDEALLLEAEATAVEAGGDLENATTIALRNAAASGIAASIGASGTTVPWWSPRDPMVALVGRPDGIWRSRDGGMVFNQVWSGAGVGVFAEGLDGVLIAGSTEGIVYSLDGGSSWIDVDDATDETAVTTLVVEGGRLYAGTALGLFTSIDGIKWDTVAGLPLSAIRTVVPDPQWEGGLWVVAGSGLLRSDDAGKTFYNAGRDPMRALRGMKHGGTPGLLLAWGGDGVWASTDAGVSWSPQVRLLTQPDVRDLVVVDGRPVIATADGLWEMVRPPEMESAEERREMTMPLGVVVGIATSRQGLDRSLLSLTNRNLLARITPVLNLHVGYDRTDFRSADFLALTNVEYHNSDWSGDISFCWGACATSYIEGDTVAEVNGVEIELEEGQTVDDLDPDDVAAAMSEGDAYFVIGDEVLDDDNVVAAAATTAEKIGRYQVTLAQEVADTWITRQRLAAERPTAQTLSLQAQVDHELKIAELDARLDAWTNGAFTRALNAEESP